MRDSRSFRKKARLLFNLSTSSTSWERGWGIHVRETMTLYIHLLKTQILIQIKHGSKPPVSISQKRWHLLLSNKKQMDCQLYGLSTFWYRLAMSALMAHTSAAMSSTKRSGKRWRLGMSSFEVRNKWWAMLFVCRRGQIRTFCFYCFNNGTSFVIFCIFLKTLSI